MLETVGRLVRMILEERRLPSRVCSILARVCASASLLAVVWFVARLVVPLPKEEVDLLAFVLLFGLGPFLILAPVPDAPRPGYVHTDYTGAGLRSIPPRLATAIRSYFWGLFVFVWYLNIRRWGEFADWPGPTLEYSALVPLVASAGWVLFSGVFWSAACEARRRETPPPLPEAASAQTTVTP